MVSTKIVSHWLFMKCEQDFYDKPNTHDEGMMGY